MTTVSNFVLNSTSLSSSSSSSSSAARRPRGRPRKYFKPEDLSIKKPSAMLHGNIPGQNDAGNVSISPNSNYYYGHHQDRPISAVCDADSGDTSSSDAEPEISTTDDPDLSRIRKERKLYSDEWALGDDDDIEGGITVVNIAEKLEAPKFEQNFIKEMHGEDFNMAYLQSNGFNNPILFQDKSGLGMQVPSPTFTVKDVRICVGSRRIVDVVDVITQKNVQMTMKDFQKYYDDPHKDKLYNVISLEFSHTRLENYVKTPNIVRQIDWVDCVWPRYLKELQKEGTNSISDMMYPKVQKYCLMSVKGCYTDFHIDFGGTSVWYHILKGKKVFWLIPPTERNIQLYEQWALSGKQNDIFFGDTVERCGRVHLNEGDTFFIPTGWIHAVYTLKDSLVFGGNFLHSFAMEKQLRIVEAEDTIRVQQKFRYPFFVEMLWFVLERYVHTLLGTSHLKIDNAPLEILNIPVVKQEHVHLTQQELHGLKAIIKYLHTLPSNKKSVPYLIPDPILLVKDVRKLIETHCHDKPEYAVTGVPVLLAPEINIKKSYKHDDNGMRGKVNRTAKCNPNGPRRRRTRCKRCQACQQSDCGECVFCLDMVKFGGPGRAKQTCIMRQCLQPMLPITAACSICGLDGWGQQIIIPIQKVIKDTPSSLMECCICYEICHPSCLSKQITDVDPMFNEDLPNSWECLKCCKDGKNVEYKPRHFRARNKFSGTSKIRRISFSSDASSNRRILEDSEQSDGDSSDDKSIYDNMYNRHIITPKKRKYEVSYGEHHVMERNGKRSHEDNNVSQDTPLSLIDRKDIIVPLTSASPTPPVAVHNDVQIEFNQYIKEEDITDNSSNSSSSSTSHTSSSSDNNSECEGAINLTTTGGNNHHRVKSEIDNDNDVNNYADDNDVELKKRNSSKTILQQQQQQIQPPIIMAIPTVPIVANGGGGGNGNNNNSSNNNNKPLRRPIFPVRPAPYSTMVPGNAFSSSMSTIADNNDVIVGLSSLPTYMTKRVLLLIFQQLSPADLGKCSLVCRAWANIAIDPSLWRKIDVTSKQLTGNCLSGIVRRQPDTLIMDWTQIAKRQLEWLMSRSPQLKELSLQGCTWNGVSALRMCSCPPLISLDVSFVNGMNDMSLRDILLPPKDTRPGLIDTKSRLRNLKTLKLAGCDVSDISVRYIVQNLPHLTTLDLSQCFRITDAGIAQLIAPPATTISTLVSLDLSGCNLITDTTVDYLMRCTALKYLDLRHAPAITGNAVEKFARARTDLTVIQEKLFVKICQPLVDIGSV